MSQIDKKQWYIGSGNGEHDYIILDAGQWAGFWSLE
jgi:hypothetical protein